MTKSIMTLLLLTVLTGIICQGIIWQQSRGLSVCGLIT